MLTPEARRSYSSDVTDEQWSLIEPILTNEIKLTQPGRIRKVSLREAVNAIFYVGSNGDSVGSSAARLPSHEYRLQLFRTLTRQWQMEPGRLRVAHSGSYGRRPRHPVRPASTLNQSRQPRWA